MIEVFVELITSDIEYYDANLPSAPIRPGSIRIFCQEKATPMADDFVGNILGKSFCGTINYVTGKLNLRVFDSELTDKVLTITYIGNDEIVEVTSEVNHRVVPGKPIIQGF